MAYLGSAFFAFGLATSLGSALASIWGIKKRDQSAVQLSIQLLYLHFISLTISIGVLLFLLLKPDFTVIYVAENVNLGLPLFYRFTAIWAGQSGSMLWWNFLHVAFSLMAVLSLRKKQAPLVPYTIAILMFISFFFAALGNFSPTSDPFRLIQAGEELYSQPDGRGLNPLLQHWAMIIHPPILYFGYISFAIPFAIAMAALAYGQVNLQWTMLARRWTLFSWFFLGTGMLLGGKWAYEELGWGGYWAWDPVENASLMPFLTGTAFLHSIVVQERRGMLKVWNMILVSLSFIMTIFGTFLTRSGIVNSVHSFANSNLGPFFVGFMVLTAVLSFGLILKRLPILKPDRPFHSFLSREAAFLFNNVLLLISLFIVVWGTMYPAITEALFDERVSVSSVWFNQFMAPLGLAILFLTGAGPLLAWRKTEPKVLLKNFQKPLLALVLTFSISYTIMPDSWVAALTFSIAAFTFAASFEEIFKATTVRRAFSREPLLPAFILTLIQNKRRFMGYMIHAGLAILFIGFAGKAYTVEGQILLKPKEVKPFRDYTIELETVEEKLIKDESGENIRYNTTLAKINIYKNNERIGQDQTEIRNYLMYSLSEGAYTDSQQTSEPAIITAGFSDLYFQIGGAETGGYRIQFWYNPLVRWVWIGFAFIVVIGVLLILPVFEKKTIRFGNKEYSIAPQANKI
jgi:cytochrome c-type biogenesis protein CcmF